MISTSPVRRRRAAGFSSLVSPPMRKIAGFPRLPRSETGVFTNPHILTILILEEK
jgi:hypothetical protein